MWRWVAITLWIASTAASLWWYQGRYLIPVTQKGAMRAVKPEDPIVAEVLGASTGRPILVNFWNPNCPCSEFAEPEVRHIQTLYGGRFDLVTVVVTDEMSPSKALSVAQARQIPGRLVAETTGAICRKFDVLSAPAAVIFDRDRHLIFRGSYNTARFCDSADTAFAEKALAATLTGQPVKVKSLPFFGCTTFPNS